MNDIRKRGDFMGHKNRNLPSLREQVYENLQSKKGFGRSKHQDKKNGVSHQYIYSFNSMKTYMKHCFYFVEWCRNSQEITADLGHKARTLEECEGYVEAFIRDREKQEFSAYTVKMEKSALSKLYGKTFDFTTIATSRATIKRSREKTGMDAHFSETNNAELVNLCRCVGFRRSELEQARAEDLRKIGDYYFMDITGKGGKTRSAMLCGTPEEIERAVEYIRTLTGKNKIHGAMDVHSYRADYATRIYNKYKRDIEEIRGKKIDYTELTGKTDKSGGHIYKTAVYYCRNDRKGVSLDRLAMIMASQSLGHNRESVVGEHYIKLN